MEPKVIPFEILDHPADIGFRAFGRTLPELFENAALAMLSIRAEVEDVQPQQETRIAATGADSNRFWSISSARCFTLWMGSELPSAASG